MVELILAGSQQDFPVVDGGQVVGVLTRADILAALAQGRQSALVQEVMRGEFQVVDSAEMLERASDQLRTCDCHTLPVTHDGVLVGLLTMDNIGEFLMIKSALDAAQGRRRFRAA
ncbi:MAG: CBS domain-containing protein [Anaerolineales bacterium]|nr:CBS domain-containing protein [Anaerolineales bacterium]